MYTLACKDMGATDCDYKASDETMDGLMMKMKEHAMSAHPDKMAEMNMPENEMMEMMKSKAKME